MSLVTSLNKKANCNFKSKYLNTTFILHSNNQHKITVQILQV